MIGFAATIRPGNRLMSVPTPPSPIPKKIPASAPRDQTRPLPSPGSSEPESEPRFAPAERQGEFGRLGRYRVLRKIGQGGMGAVYLGFDQGLQRKVALKVMLPEYSANRPVRERFLREARSAAQVKSDHVVTIFDVGEEQGVPYIAMEYLQGCTLAHYLDTRGELTVGQAVRIAGEAALGLAAAHAKGLVHRDVKPTNLWLEAPRGRVKLLDFGLARQEKAGAEITQTGLVVGTPSFMSPEQARAQRVDVRSDLFSLGSVLYRLCSSRLPFQGDSPLDVLTALTREDPPPLRRINPEVPDALAALVHRLLEKDPDHRIQTAREVVAVLQTIASSTPSKGEQEDAPRINPRSEDDWPGLDNSSDSETSGSNALPGKRKRTWIWVALGLSVVATALLVMILNLGNGSDEPVGDGSDPTVNSDPIMADPNSTSRWVLSAGGSITIRTGAGEREIRSSKEALPATFQLKRVNLSDRPITGRELGYLNNLPDLDYLSLKGTPITDAGLKGNLQGLPNLTQLELGGTRITDEALACLARLPKLHSLWLEQTRVGDEAMTRYVKDVDGMKRIYLNHTQITDAGLEPLLHISDLWELSLSHTTISDAGLLHLQAMKSLRGISLESTRITRDGLSKLRAALPSCNIGADSSLQQP
jgi:serine/threonine protein kinase